MSVTEMLQDYLTIIQLDKNLTSSELIGVHIFKNLNLFILIRG